MKKKILLISGSNPRRTPFIEFYENLLNNNGIAYDLLYWNRDAADSIDGDRANYIVYDKPLYIYSNPLKKLYCSYKFYRFAKAIIKEGGYAKIVSFTILTSLFFQQLLSNKYKENYIFDIRDHSPLLNNKLLRHIFSKLVANSFATVISSEGFKKWLPQNKSYVISHNIDRGLLSHDYKINQSKDRLNILTIGFFVRFDPNGILIKSLKNIKNVNLSFVGYGPCYSQYEVFCRENAIQNVDFRGRYTKSEELSFYDNCDMVNILLTHTLNSDTCMSNRFYNAVVCRKPMIVNGGCYQAELVDKYKLGIVISNYENVGQQILDYYKNLDWSEYLDGCRKYLSDIESDYNSFENTVLSLVNK